MDRNCPTRLKPPLPDLTEPAAIAFSGGGDSTALLYACRNHQHINHAFIIDHGLRDDSAAEVDVAADFARALGYQVQTRRWAHGGISTGIQVKARQYRYAAMGQMCRDAGLAHLVTAHTADDQAETVLMRLDRQTGWRGLAGMRERAMAPLWPALMGVTLHRPWLHVSRAELRAFNANAGLQFVDDPSNENRDFTRIRARQALSVDSDLRRDLLKHQKLNLDRLMSERRDQVEWLSRFAKVSRHGYVQTTSIPSPELLLHLLNSVSGRGGPIDSAKRHRLANEMRESGFSGTTLAGAWITKTSNGFLFTRDLVAVKGRREVKVTGGARVFEVKPNAGYLWDGRFFVETKDQCVKVEPAYGQIGKLRDISETKQIFDCPPEARGCLPIYSQDKTPKGFGACETNFFKAEAVSAQRLQHLS